MKKSQSMLNTRSDKARMKNNQINDIPQVQKTQVALEKIHKQPNAIYRNEYYLLRNTYPPLTKDMKGKLRIYHSYAWEESEFPLHYVNDFNENLDAVTVVSHYVKKVLQDSGVNIPIYVTHNGVDHIGKGESGNNKQSKYLLSQDKFSFVHVSSCFPRKGADVLLRAYAECFSDSDAVELIIKTFPNPHNDIEEQFRGLKEKFPRMADVVIINQNWPELDRTRKLYQDADVLVIPNRGEGFGLPIAEALFLGTPVITTGYGGHLDFLGGDYPWLIDFQFERASTHLTTEDSYWVNPDVNDLKRLLLEAYNTSSEKRKELANQWGKYIREHFTWRSTAVRIHNAIGYLKETRKTNTMFPPEMHLVVVSTWNTKCGVAEYTRNLLKSFSSKIKILAPEVKEEEKINSDGPHVIRNWLYNNVDPIINYIRALDPKSLDILMIQYHTGFFDVDSLTMILKEAHKKGIYTCTTFHNAKATIEQTKNEYIPVMANKISTIFVHSINDLNIIKTQVPLLLRNTKKIPHGMLNIFNKKKSIAINRDTFSIATFGFLYPNKGVILLIRSIAKLLESYNKITCELYCTLWENNENSRAYFIKCKNEIKLLGLTNIVTLHTNFLPEEECLSKLSRANLLVLPYVYSGESSSAAARMCLSSGTPLLYSRASIFDDIAPIIHFIDQTTPEGIAETIKKLIENPEILNNMKQRQAQRVELYSWKNVSKKTKSIITQRIYDKQRQR